jgi:hypothetical protein
MIRFLAVVLCLGLNVGCTSRSRNIPEAKIAFASVDYEVGDWTNAKACGTYILGANWATVFDHESARLSGNVVIPFFSSATPEEGAALYQAITKVKDATNLYAPQFKTKRTGIWFLGFALFGERCSWVRARTVTLKGGPVPNAH